MHIGTMVKAGEDLEKLKKKRKSETCEEQLRRMCAEIADSITSPEMITDEETGEKRQETAANWMMGTYDIRYLVNRDKQYLGAEICVAGGGPTIWVDTFEQQVKGYWGTDRVTVPFCDTIGLDEYCEEMCSY